jgi:hypothetical protein
MTIRGCKGIAEMNKVFVEWEITEKCIFVYHKMLNISEDIQIFQSISLNMRWVYTHLSIILLSYLIFSEWTSWHNVGFLKTYVTKADLRREDGVTVTATETNRFLSCKSPF